jgi:hypothetical protein
LQAGSAAGRNRRRSSGTHCATCFRHSPRKTCTHSCRCALPLSSAEDPCRNIRSSAGVAAPWSTHDVWARRIIANQPPDSNDESPSISAMLATASTP